MFEPAHHFDPEQTWNYPARPDPTSIHDLGVVDGDTFDLWIWASPTSIQPHRIRFMHISTSEIRFVKKDSEEYRKGMAHYEFVLEWIRAAVKDAEENDTDWPLLVRTMWTRGARDRWLADIYDAAENSLADALIDEFGDDVRTPEDWY